MYSKKNYNLNELPDFVSILKNDLNLSKVALAGYFYPRAKATPFCTPIRNSGLPSQSLFRKCY